jgi:dTDP-glucose pyrophosphorylase
VKTLLLAAGGSQAFVEAGYHYPKNLVELAGAPLLSHVVAGLGEFGRDGRLVAVLRRDEALRHHTPRVLSLIEPTATSVEVGETSGAACSALLAAGHILPDEPLLVVNGDQVITADLSAVVAGFVERDLDVGVVVFRAVHPRWSYVRLEGDRVIEAAEKNPISDLATAGCYWFRRGRDFVTAAMDMMRKDAHVDGRFFVCPALNELVLRGAEIGVTEIARSDYFSLHEPAGVLALERHLSPSAQELQLCPTP